MQSRNPVLSRIGQEPGSTGGSGFAYQEGVNAYQQAQPGLAATDLAAQTQGVRRAPAGAGAAMTLSDVIVKTAISFGFLLVGAVIGWQLVTTSPLLFWGAMIGGLVLGLVNAFKREVSPPLVLAYAFVQGVFLGGISWTYDAWVQNVNPSYTGLVAQAVIATLVVFGVMLALYQSRIVKVNGTFMKVMMVGMISYLVIAIASVISSLFGVGGGWGFYGVGGLGIALMAFAVLLAAFSLMLDFEAINRGIAMGLPERESWRMAFGLLVTLIWLYLEILRLLAILASNRE